MITILALIYSLSDFSFLNIIPRAPLPEKYKGYREFRDGIMSADHQSELLFNSDNETRFYDAPPLFNAINNTVIVTKQTNIKKGQDAYLYKTYLKLDANGKVIDSLTFSRGWPTDWAGYLMTPHGYYSWILDGDKQMHHYSEQNSTLAEDGVSLAQHFKQLYQAAQLVYYYSTFDLEDPRLESLQADKALFYQHGQWVALLGKNLLDFDAQGYKTKGNSQVKAMANRADNYHLDKRNAFIYMDYFQKEAYRKGRGPSMGSPTGLSSPDQWEGIAFLHLILKNDTLRVQQEMYRDEDRHSTDMSPYRPPVPIYYFTCEQVNFSLFANNDYQLFIIRNKTK